MNDINNKLDEFQKSLKDNNRIVVQKFLVNPQHHSVVSDLPLGKKIFAMYEQLGDFICRWIPADPIPDAFGSAKILSFEQSTSDWKNEFISNNDEAAGGLELFHPIDFFSDQACTGFYAQNGRSDSLYYYDLVHEPKYLQLEMDAYFELMIYSKAFRYWPLLIIEEISGEKSKAGDDMRKNLAALFPEFNHDEFVNIFNRLKI